MACGLALLAAVGPGVAQAATTAMAATASRQPAVDWLEPRSAEDFDRQVAQARAQGRLQLLYWGATWCPPCRQLEVSLFHRADFVALTRRLAAIHLDGDAPGAQKIGARHKVRGYPTMVLLGVDGRELTRLPGEAEPAQYLEALRSALAQPAASQADGAVPPPATSQKPVGPQRSVADLLAQARRASAPAGGLTAAEWRRLAWYAWFTDESALLPEAERSAVLQGLAGQAAATAPAAASRMRLLAVVFSKAAGGPKTQDALSPADRQAALADLQGLLSRPEAAREQADLLTEAVEDLAERLTAAGSPQRAELVRRWQAAAIRLQQDTRLTRATRLMALYARVQLTQLGQDPGAPLPKALTAEVTRTVAQTEASLASPSERQVLMPLAAELLSLAGAEADSQALLKRQLDKSIAPYYFMSMLAGQVAKSGDTPAALDWSRQAWESARGSATRLQWGASHLARLIDLAPQDGATIESVAAAILAEAAATPEVYHERNARSLQRLARRLNEWSLAQGETERLQRLASQLAPVCAQLPAGGSARSQCDSLLAPGG